MVREPRLGKVKSRLAKSTGNLAAAHWYRRNCARIIGRIGVDDRWQTFLAVTPDNGDAHDNIWPSALPRIPQGSGSLGDRMVKAFRQLPPGPSILIGSDVPGITAVHIARAFRVLVSHEVVFGPSPDGGYWLVGLKRTRAIPAGFLAGVRWSSEHALEDSVSSVSALRVGFADILSDVDTLEEMSSAWSGSRFPDRSLEGLSG